MKYIALVTIGIILFAFIPTKKSEPLAIGAALPNATTPLTNIDSKEITMQQAAKVNGLLVMFSCNTCPYVIKNQERTVAIAKFAQQNNVGVIILNSNEALRSDADSYKAMQEYYKAQNYQWPYVLDANSVMADAFGATRTPECFLFNKELILTYHGAIDDNPADATNITRNHLEIAITEQVNGKEISTKTTRSVGCTIKRKKA